MKFQKRQNYSEREKKKKRYHHEPGHQSKEHEGTLRSDENVVYFSYGGGYMTVLIGQNLPKYTLKIH